MALRQEDWELEVNLNYVSSRPVLGYMRSWLKKIIIMKTKTTEEEVLFREGTREGSWAE